MVYNKCILIGRKVANSDSRPTGLNKARPFIGEVVPPLAAHESVGSFILSSKSHADCALFTDRAEEATNPERLEITARFHIVGVPGWSFLSFARRSAQRKMRFG